MGTPAPNSLASLLELPPVDPEHPPHPGESAEDEAALLSYLKDNYAVQGDSSNVNRSNRQVPVPPQRSPTASPPNKHIKIDPALEEVAEKDASNAAFHDIAPPSQYWVPEPQDEYGTFGEMGGKRKKLPHERAGWREMDESGEGGKKKSSRKKSATSGVELFTGSAPEPRGDGMNGAGNLERDLLQADRETQGVAFGLDGEDIHHFVGAEPSGQSQEPLDQSGGETDDAGGARKRRRDVSEAKEARAEQNRRAQQAFRRRREEKMKGLEAMAAALEPTQRRLQEVEKRLAEASLALESSHIEAAALRSALRTVATVSGHSILTREGSLAINASVRTMPGPSSVQEIEDAYVLLSRQSRELAKQKRIKKQY